MYNGNVAYTRGDCFGSCNWKRIGNCSNELMSGVSTESTTKKPLSTMCIVLIVAVVLLQYATLFAQTMSPPRGTPASQLCYRIRRSI